MSPNERRFRAGDTVRHGPTGEEWVLACDELNGYVMWCGWPEGEAKASDCTLVEAAGDEERMAVLRKVALSRYDGGEPSLRALRAAEQLGATP